MQELYVKLPKIQYWQDPPLHWMKYESWSWTLEVDRAPVSHPYWAPRKRQNRWWRYRADSGRRTGVGCGNCKSSWLERWMLWRPCAQSAWDGSVGNPEQARSPLQHGCRNEDKKKLLLYAQLKLAHTFKRKNILSIIWVHHLIPKVALDLFEQEWFPLVSFHQRP